jgi:polar amino acid transport system substrate-binding protein
MQSALRSSIVLLAVLTLAACSTGGAATQSPASSPSAAASSGASASASTSAVPSASADACAAGGLQTLASGKLTIGTDNPAYPPYFDPPASGEPKTDPWELGDPTNGRGFESAVAYAVANRLGFNRADVVWTYIPFDNSYAPGPKTFDFDITQVSFSAERAQAVDMSDGYYTVNQALVANADTDGAKATTIDAVKGLKLGAQSGTTSLKYIQDTIQPTKEPSVYSSNTDAIAALNAKQIEGIVVDLPTAFFITAAQMDHGVIVGQFPSGTTEGEHFSIVLAKDSPLTPCVNAAIAAMKSGGQLDAITKEWLSQKVAAPVIAP